MKIDLIDLEADIDYQTVPAEVIFTDENGLTNWSPGYVIITSIKVKGIELITLFTPEELEAISQEISEKGL